MLFSVYTCAYLLSKQAHNNSMCITIHNLPSRREAFWFTRSWINHTFLPSILSSIMHSLLSVSKYDHPCDWLSEQMRPWLHYFSLLWDTGTPIFPGATSISLPLPHPSCLPSAFILFKDCYLYPSNQVSQVKTASHPTREAHNYRGCTALLLLVYGEKHETQHTTVPSSLRWLIVIPFLLLLGIHSLQAPLNSHLSPHQTQWQEVRLLSEINKPCSNTHTHRHRTRSAGLLEQ